MVELRTERDDLGEELLWLRHDDGMQRMREIEVAIEQHDTASAETAGSLRIAVARGQLDLPRHLAEGQIVELAVDEGDHFRCLALLPATQQAQAAFALVAVDGVHDAQQAILQLANVERMQIAATCSSGNISKRRWP